MRLIETLRKEFDAWHQPKRTETQAFKEARHLTLEQLVLNLLSLQLADARGWLFITTRKAWFAENRSWLGDRITHNAVELCLRFLSGRHYIVVIPGRSSASVSFRRPTAIRPLAKFRRLIDANKLTVHDVRPSPAAYPIRLKAPRDGKGKKARVQFDPTPETDFMASKVVAINRMLLRHWVDIEITHQQAREVARRLAARVGGGHFNEASDDDEYPAIDLTRRTVYRVFNNGTFEDGGRFYGGWWQNVPSEYRRYITIDGKQTVEVDYSAMHPTMLYYELGLSMPSAPYDIGIGDHALVKRTVNALINAGGPNINPVEGFSRENVGMDWSEFRHKVRAAFAPFEPYFGTGYGLKLQRKDSDIAEAVMVEFAEHHIPILPIHDSFLVHHGNASLLQKVMSEKFDAIVGTGVGLKTTILDDETRSAMRGNSGFKVTKDLDALLNPTGPYAEHDRRLSDWFDRRMPNLD